MDRVGRAPGGGHTGEVLILNAGVLHRFVADGLARALREERAIAVRHESGPSVGLARALQAGDKAADVFMSADAQVNALLMGNGTGKLVRWYVTFARNEVVLAYSPKGRCRDEFDQAAAGAIPWYEPLLHSDARLVRGDPDLDPLAYYTLLVGQLGELHHGILGLKQRILGDDRNPAQLVGMSLGGLASGEVDAIFLYRSLALDLQLPFVALPDAINLGAPEHAAGYARASYTTDQGETFRGGPIRVSAAPLANAANPDRAVELVAYLVSADGQRLARDYRFLPTNPDVSGDLAALPPSLKHLATRPGPA